MDFDTRVKLTIYETIAQTGQTPAAADLAAAMDEPLQDLLAAFDRLAARRLLVLAPNDRSRIRMAPPFSGVPTPHVVQVEKTRYFANCAWDALGICAALHKDGDVFSSCADCGEPMDILVRHGRPVARECTVHFAVPAAKWWEDIIFS